MERIFRMETLFSDLQYYFDTLKLKITQKVITVKYILYSKKYTSCINTFERISHKDLRPEYL